MHTNQSKMLYLRFKFLKKISNLSKTRYSFILTSTKQLTSFVSFLHLFRFFVFKELDRALGNSVIKLSYETPQKAASAYGQYAVIN